MASDKENESLLTALLDSDGKIRAAAIEELAKKTDPTLIPLLYPFLLFDPYYAVRQTAARAIAVFDDPRVVDAFIIALPDYAVLGIVAPALARIGDPRAIGPLIDALEGNTGKLHAGAPTWAVATFGEKAVEPLLAALSRPHGVGLVASALAQIGDVRAIAPILTVAANKQLSEQERRGILLALGELRDSRAFAYLVQTMNDAQDAVMVRMAAAQALSYFAEPAFPLLLDVLGYEMVGYGAAMGLAMHGDKTTQLLTDALHSSDTRVRVSAVLGLGWVCDPVSNPLYGHTTQRFDLRPLDTLLAALHDSSFEVRKTVLGAIDGFLRSLTCYEENHRAAEKLHGADQEALPTLDRISLRGPLVACMTDVSGEVRASAATALGALGINDPLVITALTTALHDADSDVRSSAESALSSLRSRYPDTLFPREVEAPKQPEL